ncbi:endonuclease/exonuclease/phosphatase [Actinomadura graeca]|uniref:Endonuclease/exonuclease/phosphatase n=2 Tax=Actinomadura graeca TaxID=2750812 RepID=A0ABX8R7Q3_9ACTN|nr:endonuclease/exonuclease/phosphatase [Actinomadura graeca]
MLAAPVAVATAAALLTAVPPASAAGPVRIHDIQGAGHVSPLERATVSAVPGVVTALTGNGFWMQDPRPDRDDATSEGVFVYTRTRPSAVVGDSVRVDGRVSEFRPGGARSAGLTRTEIDAAATVVDAHGTPLPAPAVLGPGGRRAPASVVKDGRGDVEKGGRFDPRRNGLDFYESLEGMRVRIQDAVAAGPSRYGELPVLPANGAGAGTRTARGGVLLRDGDPNPERVILDDALAPLPGMNVGDRLPGAGDGVLDYGYGDFKLLLTATPRRADGGLPREATRPARPGELAVATAGLDGLDPDSPPERFRALADDIVRGLRSPDLVAVSGLRDNSGEADDGTVAADQTVAELITAISEAGGPGYDWRSVNPRDNADGGERGTNGRVGFLFRTDRGLAFVDRPSPAEPMADGPPPGGPDPAVTPVRAVRRDGAAGLTLSPGRIAPGDAAWGASRKPLAGEVTWQGRRIIVIAAQWFGQAGEDQPLFGRFQPPSRPSEWRRDAQAKVVAGFVRSIRNIDGDAGVIVAGDLNGGEFSAPVRTLAKEGGLADLPAGLKPSERYTAVSDGNSQLLDHILLSPSLKRRHEFDVVHRNAEFADRAGDRDPAVVRIGLSGR